jgi:hypothetical protein
MTTDDRTRTQSEEPQRIHPWRLVRGVLLILAALAVGRLAGEVLAAQLAAGALDLARPENRVALWGLVIDWGVWAASGLRVAGLTLPALSLSVVIGFWSACANVVPDLIAFARTRAGRWETLLRPAAGLCAAAFTLAAVAPALGTENQYAQSPHATWSVVFIGAAAGATEVGEVVPARFAQLPIVYFPMGRADAAGRLADDGSQLDPRYERVLGDFLDVVAACRDESAPALEVEVAGFANTKPFRGANGERLPNSDDLNVQQANRRGDALKALLERLGREQGIEIVVHAQPWSKLGGLDDKAHEHFESLPWIPFDSKADQLRSAVVTSVTAARCTKPAPIVASKE